MAATPSPTVAAPAQTTPPKIRDSQSGAFPRLEASADGKVIELGSPSSHASTRLDANSDSPLSSKPATSPCHSTSSTMQDETQLPEIVEAAGVIAEKSARGRALCPGVCDRVFGVSGHKWVGGQVLRSSM
eukprot:14277489-Alexandrium_andersonii.AAC.1